MPFSRKLDPCSICKNEISNCKEKCYRQILIRAQIYKFESVRLYPRLPPQMNNSRDVIHSQTLGRNKAEVTSTVLMTFSPTLFIDLDKV